MEGERGGCLGREGISNERRREGGGWARCYYCSSPDSGWHLRACPSLSYLWFFLPDSPSRPRSGWWCDRRRRGGWAAGRRPQDLRVNVFVKFFIQQSLPARSGATRSRPPGSGAAGVYFYKFRTRKYIFIKNENKKYKNKKTAQAGPPGIIGGRKRQTDFS